MMIRQEREKDLKEVYKLVKEAFAKAEHSDGTEQELAAALRGSRAFVPKLSLVAEIEGKIVGHILFTQAKVGKAAVLALAPLSVLPAFQNIGIGSALILEGHRIAEELGYGYSLVLGSPQYYPRFGYVPAGRLGIEAPDSLPQAYLMAASLGNHPEPVKGEVVYAEEFGICQKGGNSRHSGKMKQDGE